MGSAPVTRRGAAAGGYPGDYNTGDQIHGLPLEDVPDGKVFHAGTTLKDDLVVTSGGRVLCVTALGEDVAAAQKNAALAQHLMERQLLP